ncbi:hypothetical protein PanWU01x14_053980, partial [Parasponia andersonii]
EIKFGKMVQSNEELEPKASLSTKEANAGALLRYASVPATREACAATQHRGTRGHFFQTSLHGRATFRAAIVLKGNFDP